MDEAILRVENLTKSFDGTVANDGVTLTIERGEFHGIIGPNGSGKTTLFNTITGYYRPDSGYVRFEGEDITGQAPDEIARRGLVRTFQITSPFRELTVRQNLLATYDGSRIRIRSDHRERAEELLALLELDHVAEQKAGEISGGQQKLLELGRAMMRDPDCLLLDEPAASVNPATETRLLEHLREVNENGTTIVIIEHDMDVIDTVTDRLTVLNRGSVVTQGPFEEVTAATEVQEAYLGSPAPNTPPDADTTRQASADPPVATTDVKPSGTSDTRPEQDRDRLVGTDIVTGYGNHTVLRGVSVKSHDGVTCIFGPNGSGKSTLLNALAGVLPVWSGKIEYGTRRMDGRDAHEFIEAGVSMVPQRNMVFRGLTVRENLQLGGTTVPEDHLVEERLDSVLDAFPPLERNLSQKVGSLSGGQQTMVGFGRAMMTDSDVYLLDEPTSSLDPSITDDVFEMIQTLVDDDAQVVLVEQNVRESLPFADHVYILAQGEIQFDGKPGELRDSSDLLRNYLGIESD